MDMKLLYNSALCIASIMAISCGNKSNEFDATGTFEAEEVTVSSEMSGKILSLNLQDGQKVTEDERVGIIDSIQLYLTKEQLMNNLKGLQASIPDAKAQLAALKEQLAKQKTEKARIESLYKSNAATEKQVDDINSSISVLEGQISAAQSSLQKSTSTIEAQMAALKVQIAQVDDQLKKCNISSPINGIVLSRYARKGELAVVGKPLFKVADTDNMTLKAYFTLGQLTDIKLGQKVKVCADFGGNNIREYEGTISWISDKSEFTPKSIQTKNDRENLVYAVKILVKNDGYIKIGMYGEVLL